MKPRTFAVTKIAGLLCLVGCLAVSGSLAYGCKHNHVNKVTRVVADTGKDMMATEKDAVKVPNTILGIRFRTVAWILILVTVLGAAASMCSIVHFVYLHGLMKMLRGVLLVLAILACFTVVACGSAATAWFIHAIITKVSAAP